MKRNLVRPQGFIDADVWEEVYSTIVSGGAVTSLPVTGLTGDTDGDYLIEFFLVTAVNATQILLQLHGDAGANYGYQSLIGVASSLTALRLTGLTGIELTYGNAVGEVAYSQRLVSIKSGTIRPMIGGHGRTITGTTVTEHWALGGVWNNSGTEATSLSAVGTTVAGIDDGSYLAVYRKRSS